MGRGDQCARAGARLDTPPGNAHDMVRAGHEMRETPQIESTEQMGNMPEQGDMNEMR